jgi:hypothetical protein
LPIAEYEFPTLQGKSAMGPPVITINLKKSNKKTAAKTASGYRQVQNICLLTV